MESGDDFAYSMIETSDGGFAIAGCTTSFGAGEYSDYWLIKTDENGTVEWNQTYGGTGVDEATSLVEAFDGGYAIAGITVSFDDGPNGCWLVKTDEFGNMEWNRTYGGTGSGIAYSVVVTYDIGYALVGCTGGFPYRDVWLFKTDEFGNMEWNRTYGGTNDDSAYSLVKTPLDGGYTIAGWTKSFGAGNYDAWLIKTDVSGNMEWNRTYGDSENEGFNSVVATSDGGCAIAGYTESFGARNEDVWLIKTNATGYMMWNQTYGGTGNERAFAVIKTSDGGYAIASHTAPFGSGAYDVWLIKTDEFGSMEWNQTYGGPDDDSACAAVQTSDGGYAIAGDTNLDIWLIKTDEYGFVPEYSSWLIPSLLLTATMFIVIYKKRLFNQRS